MSSTVQVGSYSDQAPTYTVTLTRHADDTNTDYSTIASVALLLPDGTTRPVTVQGTPTVSQWVGTVTYGAWWSAAGVYATRARATFADGRSMTFADNLVFSVGS